MKGILNTPNLFSLCKYSTRRLSSVRTTQDQFHQPDATPEEIRIVKERQKLRKALKDEYLRKITDPHCTEPIVFNPSMQRFYSMHMTITERFVPTFKNWCGYMATCLLPIFFYGLYLKRCQEEKERVLRSGSVEYKDRYWKFE